jgi:hypothetical protein
MNKIDNNTIIKIYVPFESSSGIRSYY